MIEWDETLDYRVEYTTNPLEGIQLLAKNSYDVLLLDIVMPNMTGFDILKWLKEKGIMINTIMISAHSELQNAIKATRLGAFDFLEKPLDREKVLISIRNAIGHTQLVKENISLKEKLQVEETIVGESDIIKNLLDTVEKVAVTDAAVLITGENGVGKELIARMIHNKSKRASQQLLEVNCAAIPKDLIESELFGHVKELLPEQ